MFASIASSSWAYPALSALHVVGVALLLGNLVLLELRVWGAGKALPVRDLARLSLALVAVGFALAAASGLLMFATQAAELLTNRAFVLKMLLLSLAGCNAGIFHARGGLTKLDGLAKAQMLLSTLIWLSVIACGRWIAFS